jgi:hypothetical protein
MFFDLRSVTIEQRRFDFCSEISFVRIRVSTIIEWCLRSSSYAIWFYLTVVLLFIVLSILKKVIGVVILVNLTLFFLLRFIFSKFFDFFFGIFLLVLWISWSFVGNSLTNLKLLVLRWLQRPWLVSVVCSNFCNLNLQTPSFKVSFNLFTINYVKYDDIMYSA